MSFDFSKYGYNYTLSKTSSLIKHRSHLSTIESIAKNVIATKKNTYTLTETLGIGSFGITYKATSKNREVAIKKIKPKDLNGLWDSVKEVLLQILLYDATKNLSDGPYVPEVYEIGYNPDKKSLYIIQEVMDGTLEDLISNRSKEENDIKLLDDFDTIAKQLEWLGTHLQFNHRDLKSDNIMYKLSPKGYVLRLIDFGLSCMTWKEIHLQAATHLFSASSTCYHPSRDLLSLFIAISYDFRLYLSNKMIKFINEFLKFRIEDENINMLNYKLQWENTYNFLNSKNVNNPKARPSYVRKTIKASKHATRGTRKRCRH